MTSITGPAPSNLITNATPENARDLAILINYAGEGMPKAFWRDIAGPGEDPLEVGMNRARREDGDFSYKNARIIMPANKVLALCIAFPLSDPYDTGDMSTYPDYIQPLVELESKAPGSWYINVLATYPEYRRKGYGKALMTETFERGRAQGFKTTSIIVNRQNMAAFHLYEKLGFKESESAEIRPIQGCDIKGEWVLLKMPL